MSLVLAGIVALVLLHFLLASLGGTWPFTLVVLGAGLWGRHLREKAQP